MTTCILHGGFLSRDTPENAAMYRRIATLVPEGGTVLICLFASTQTEAEDAATFEKYRGLVEGYAPGKGWRFVRASHEGFVGEARDADCVIIRGGSTNKLLDALRSHDGVADALRGRVVVGSSAGAYALSALNFDKSARAAREGLGVAPVKTLCHFESETAENPGEGAREIMEAVRPDLPLVMLRDGEWKEFSV